MSAAHCTLPGQHHRAWLLPLPTGTGTRYQLALEG